VILKTLNMVVTADEKRSITLNTPKNSVVGVGQNDQHIEYT
jgi:hypothetical protein